MEIVETIALFHDGCATDLVMRCCCAGKRLTAPRAATSTSPDADIRRGAIIAILLLGYFYLVAGRGERPRLHRAQCPSPPSAVAPLFLGGLYWKGGTRNGASPGFRPASRLVYTLLLPAFAKSGWFGMEIVEHGPSGSSCCGPRSSSGCGPRPDHARDDLEHVANIGAYVCVSLLGRQSAAEHSQATLFVDVSRRRASGARLARDHSASALQASSGASSAGARAELFRAYATVRGLKRSRSSRPTRAAALRRAPARGHDRRRVGAHMVATSRRKSRSGWKEVMTIIDEASHVIAYSHELEQKKQELEEATANLRRPTNAEGARSPQGRLHLDGDARAAYPAHVDPCLLRDPARLARHRPAERHRFLGLIIKESERLTRLINQVLDLAKLESGMAEWRTGELDLCEIVATR
jgi:hypothetical protein